MSRPPCPPPLELWGGVECTVNRVGDRYFEQLERTGHAQRLADLDDFAALGITALRYPVLWERTAPHGLDCADWSWPDQRLARLRALHICPIVGLVHHGSGPPSTSLVDPLFPDKVATYARAVAARYPWVECYTPINEPLTTARFSGLYGLWYPHGRDDPTFVRALLTQCRAVALAMAAIREVNSRARLVQTDDLGKTFSTPALAHQAHFDNERRWLSYDLLCGRVTPEHGLWDYVRHNGATEAELDAFLEHPCPPDIIGINHYLSSERFLDERTELYPREPVGTNGRQRYVDVLAARVLAAGADGPRKLLHETWHRYGLPIAVTEAHNGCTREEQLRWLRDVWAAAEAVRTAGVDIRAVTVWSLLGGYDWNRMVTTDAGVYEPGVFDLRAPRPRPTAIVPMLRSLAQQRPYGHPVLAMPGWWHRPDRLVYGFAVDGNGQRRPAPAAVPMTTIAPTVAPPLVITGATGMLGQGFARACEARGLPYRLLSRRELDVADPATVGALLDALRPWAVVNAAGYAHVDAAEHDPATCFRANAWGPALLAEMCAARAIPLLTFSSDLVFDGMKHEPYIESTPVRPLNVYGRSQAEAEQRVLSAWPRALIIRTSNVFGPWDTSNFLTTLLRSIADGRPVVVAHDELISPTYVPDLVHTCLDLMIDGEQGLWHIVNTAAITRAELANRVVALAGYAPTQVRVQPGASLNRAAPRPGYSVLGSERGVLLPPLGDALERYMKHRMNDRALQPTW